MLPSAFLADEPPGALRVAAHVFTRLFVGLALGVYQLFAHQSPAFYYYLLIKGIISLKDIASYQIISQQDKMR